MLTTQQARNAGKKTKLICVQDIIDSTVSPAYILREEEEDATLEKIRGFVGKGYRCRRQSSFHKEERYDLSNFSIVSC